MLNRMARVLVTGFDPFGGSDNNPSWLVAQALHGHQVAGHRVVAARLPTVFGQSATLLAELLRKHRPVLVLCLGLAAGRAALSLERVAINIDDARIADNAGARPVDRPVRPDGPAAYFARLPVKAMVQAIRDAGIAAEVSNSAGTFVCNHVFFALLHHLAAVRGYALVRGGFMHLPCLPDQAAALGVAPCMALDDMVRGVRIGLRAALRHGARPDITLAAGATH